MNNALGFPFGFFTNDNTPADAKYYRNFNTTGAKTPYFDVTDATNLLVAGIRYQGLTINIAGAEYWFKNSIANSDLVIKTPDLSSYATTSYVNSYAQPLNGNLTSIGGLAGTTGLLRKTAINTWSLDTNTYQTPLTFSNGLTNTNGNIKLGGLLTGDVYIDPAGYTGGGNNSFQIGSIFSMLAGFSVNVGDGTSQTFLFQNPTGIHLQANTASNIYLNASSFEYAGGGATRFLVANSGTVTIPSLGGSTTNMVVASPTGILSVQSILTGTTTFAGLTDVPNSYISQKFKTPRVKEDETGLEYVNVPVTKEILLTSTGSTTFTATHSLNNLYHNITVLDAQINKIIYPEITPGLVSDTLIWSIAPTSGFTFLLTITGLQKSAGGAVVASTTSSSYFTNDYSTADYTA